MQESIIIRGARVHNLKDLSLEIPHNQLTVVTGVSGSGKSSLVFDTIYAEGQRRYVESLSSYARQFLEQMGKPDVDEIDGIAPPVAIRQRNTARNPRSTVATTTELNDFLRLLFARAGRTFCPHCHGRVQSDTVDYVAATMLGEPAGSRWYALFPLPRDLEPDALRDLLFDLRKKGFNRLYQPPAGGPAGDGISKGPGRTFEFSTPESLLEIDFTKPLYSLVDRIAIAPDLHQRLVDTTEICYRESGEVIFEEASGERRLRFGEKFACRKCDVDFSEPEPRLFSFNSPFGACPRCQGFGNTMDYDMDRVIPDPYLSLDEGAVDPWTKPRYRRFYTDFKRRLRGQVRFNVPFVKLNQGEKETVQASVRHSFELVERKKYKVQVRVFLSRYRGYSDCPECHGSRLRPEALYVRIGGKTMADVARLNISQAHAFFTEIELSPEESSVAEDVLVEIQQRLKFLNDVGLDYITLDRPSATLSGGEAQRIQLATCLSSRLVGACYVLDEPSIGLHSRDTGRLIGILEGLRELGNTIVVVEHDADIIRSADHIVDLGPGAGENGGRIVYEGSYSKLLHNGADSLTGRYLRGDLETSRRKLRRPVNPKRMIRFQGARAHNLQNIDVDLPLDMMVAVSGVSGSGKSSLVHDVMYKALKACLGNNGYIADEDMRETSEKRTWRKVEKADLLTQVVLVDQSPIGRTPRSNPVTYIKAFDIIRGLFASTTEADRHGYTAGHFSFNIPGGRCENCQGSGTVTVEMQFLADVELVCEECRGTRFKSSILDVRYRGRNIHEVLQLTVHQALRFFSDVPRLANRMQVLEEVGLGYLRLGQSATTLSGGEAQRVKLAAHLAQASCKGTLFLFDEPTTGLHFDDIAKLLNAFQKLISAGGSVLIIEHNLEVIRSADWIIDLGPEGGDAGGAIVAAGTPETVAEVASSYTGRFLKAREAGLAHVLTEPLS